MTENPASLLPQVISIMPFYDEKNLGGLSTFITIPWNYQIETWRNINGGLEVLCHFLLVTINFVSSVSEWKIFWFL